AGQIAAGLAAEGKLDEAFAFDPASPEAHLARAEAAVRAGAGPRAARDHLDRALGTGRHHIPALRLRAELAVREKDWRAARGDLDRLLDVDPADTAARRRLSRALLELGKDEDAAAAVRDTVRSDTGQFAGVLADLSDQADGLEKKFPGAPGIPAGWLARGLTAVRDGLPEGGPRGVLSDALRRAAMVPTEAERLAVLRTAVRP
ncbi:MAG TPA: tetratricopeptide repeat protein, partial [Urbifossiella sp.]|nr:tetratricopeptide repeat protein [Urbifossiella sp.]